MELYREVLGNGYRILIFQETLLKVPDIWISQGITEGKENFLQKFMNLKLNYVLQGYSVFYTDVNSILNLN